MSNMNDGIGRAIDWGFRCGCLLILLLAACLIAALAYIVHLLRS
jgi:hypothetical protein